MSRGRSRYDSDDVTHARLTGAARRKLSDGSSRAEGVAELRTIAGDRADLLRNAAAYWHRAATEPGNLDTIRHAAASSLLDEAAREVDKSQR